MPPIDPMQLLRALAPLLSSEGGIRSVEEVGRLSSLMKKFSKKLVSRCVYVNVLRASKTEDLDGFLQKGGWETIHSWLQDTKTQQNNSFLLELLKLYRVLPMTVERLKENNSAKLLKALTKSDREDIKQISTEIVNSWVKLVSGKSGAVKDDKTIKKKKRKDEKEIKTEKDKPKEKDKKDTKKDEIKKEVKNSTTSKENKAVVKTEDLEDVQLPDYIRNPEPKDIFKVKERKSTVKLYQTKFRSTGLEEPAQLPRPSAKKNVEKVPPLIISKNSVKRIGSTINKDLGPIPKKSKPPNLTLPKLEPDIAMKEQIEKPPAAIERREIKLIAPRPKPIHTLTESAGFMDALVAPVNAPIRKKRKSSGKAPTTPPSPTPTPAPKLQFYKDTLEVPEENGSNGNNKKDAIQKTPELQDGESKEVEPMEEEAVGDETPLSPKENDNDNDDTSDTNSTIASNKRKRKTKRVSWADESNLRQIFFFELDETERVNVNNVKNFGDLKTLERLKEREAVESARRMMGTGEERMSWFLYPIDNISSLIIVGSNSKEREIQKSREESVLQEIFFSKESLPETPHEPDPEFLEPEEPKIIPLEDENNLDAIMDYSMLEPPAPVTTLPPALSNLFSALGKPTNPMEVGDYNMYINMTNSDPSQQMPPNFLPPGPPNMMGPNPGLLGGGPPMFNNMGGFPGPRPPMGGPFPDGMDYYGNQGPDMPGPSGGGHPMGRPPRGQGGHRGGPNRGWGPPRGQLNNRNRGGGRGGRGRIPCHHFMAGGCKYEESCKFLHPGVNGPPL